MRWRIVGDLEDLLDDDDKVENLRDVEITFEEGRPTEAMIILKNGNMIAFNSRHVDVDGNREELCVTTTEGDN